MEVLKRKAQEEMGAMLRRQEEPFPFENHLKMKILTDYNSFE